MKSGNKQILIVLALAFLTLASCTKEAFKPSKQVTTSTTNPIQFTTSSSCSSFTLTKPPVDFLFLWDNSTSTNFINNQTKAALNNTINLVSNNFDYHIMLAPLLGSGNSYSKLVVDNINGLSSAAQNLIVDQSTAASNLSFPTVQGSYEAGASRAVSIIQNNVTNGIFRSNAYTIVVVMSNQDDSSWIQGGFPTSFDRNTYVNQQTKNLLCLRGGYTPPSNLGSCTGYNLNSKMLRFTTLAAQSACNAGWSQNRVYKEISSNVYATPYTNGNPQPTDQGNPAPHSDGIVPFDFYNICGINYTSLFDGINNSITDTLIKHKYDFWPVATSGSAPISPNEVQAFKDGSPLSLLTEPVSLGANGFSFTNTVQTQNTRYEPTPGEPFTGYLIKLYGNARIQYPECMIVQTQTPKEYFGYVHIPVLPLESSIELKINGVVVTQGGANGWELIKNGGSPQFFSNKNIKISGPGQFCPSSSSNYCPGSPAINKTGYFLQMSGNAIYSNGDTIDVNYLPGN